MREVYLSRKVKIILPNSLPLKLLMPLSLRPTPTKEPRFFSFVIRMDNPGKRDSNEALTRPSRKSTQCCK